MEKLRAWLDDASAYLAASSPRERRILALGAAGLVLFLALLVTAAFSSAISRRAEALEEKRLDWQKIEVLARTFGQHEQERQMLEARLRQSPPTLMSFVDGLAREQGLEIASMSDRGVVAGGQGGKPRESSVEVNLGKVPLDKLTRLLQSIERSPGVVRVRRLRLRKTQEQKDALDASLTVSAWQGV